VEELEEALVAGFPDTPRERIRADLRGLLAGLAEAGLIGAPLRG
jgi:hypothetical protein